MRLAALSSMLFPSLLLVTQFYIFTGPHPVGDGHVGSKSGGHKGLGANGPNAHGVGIGLGTSIPIASSQVGDWLRACPWEPASSIMWPWIWTYTRGPP